MSILRASFDQRPALMGIRSIGIQDTQCNQIGMHVYHVGEIVDIHCHDNTIHVKILGQANGHMIGKIVSFIYSENQRFETMHTGQIICFDENNIFEYYD